VGFPEETPSLDSSRVRFVLLGLLLFSAVFTLFLGAGDKKFDRYLVPIYALLISLPAWVGRLCFYLWAKNLLTASCVTPLMWLPLSSFFFKRSSLEYRSLLSRLLQPSAGRCPPGCKRIAYRLGVKAWIWRRNT